MAKKKCCRTCKRLTEGNECPVCHKGNLSISWQGRLSVVDPEKSEIAKKIGIDKQGDYAIKCR